MTAVVLDTYCLLTVSSLHGKTYLDFSFFVTRDFQGEFVMSCPDKITVEVSHPESGDVLFTEKFDMVYYNWNLTR